MVVVDRFTKYAHFLVLSHPFANKVVAETSITGVVKLQDFPIMIVSERDKISMSHFWTEQFKQTDTKLKYISAFHP